jgi:hypothetical protein
MTVPPDAVLIVAAVSVSASTARPCSNPSKPVQS